MEVIRNGLVCVCVLQVQNREYFWNTLPLQVVNGDIYRTAHTLTQ